MIDRSVRAALPNEWDTGTFVYCTFIDQHGRRLSDFGTITNREEEFYVVKLATLGGWATVPITALRMAGRA